MINDRWLIRWREYLSDSYSYGAKIEFHNDGRVQFKNELMPPGKVIHTWYSKTNFQSMRVEPLLPLMDGESAYQITLNAEYPEENHAGIMLRIVYYDRYDEEFESIIIRSEKAMFKPPIKTYSYKIELINGGCRDFIFDSLILREVSEEDFNAEQERIEKNKKYRKKDKKNRRRNKEFE